MSYKDPANRRAYRAKYFEDLKQHAYDSITSLEIRDKSKWVSWCNVIKRNSRKYPYSEDFTDDIIFEMMTKGCFYCGQLATTIDRICSNLDHTPDNCVGCCLECNNSKGAADSATFIRKAYYRARMQYKDNVTNIWFENKKKPPMCMYKNSAKKKGVLFDLTKEYFEKLLVGVCEYCRRTPTTWFGVDRVKPEDGYIIGNVVTCCFDCNLDKHVLSVEKMVDRNEKIANRVDTGDIVIEDYSRFILNTGTRKSSKKVYAYGKVYATQMEASKALGRCDTYVCECIKFGRHSEDIFEITDNCSDVRIV